MWNMCALQKDIYEDKKVFEKYIYIRSNKENDKRKIVSNTSLGGMGDWGRRPKIRIIIVLNPSLKYN